MNNFIDNMNEYLVIIFKLMQLNILHNSILQVTTLYLTSNIYIYCKQNYYI